MKILFAGKYDPLYNRTKVIIDGLKLFPEIDLSFYQYSARTKLNPFRFVRLAKEADVIFLPSFTHQDVPLINALTKKPIIFDPLISRYLTKVFDYKKVSRYSPRAFKNFLKDKLPMSMADIVLCDTHAHKHYFQSVIGIPSQKLRVLPVGVNTDEFHPVASADSVQREDNFTVGFYGSFVPLQGTKAIVETAKSLQEYTDIHFYLIGDGFEYNEVKKLALEEYKLNNISFPGWIDYAHLSEQIGTFDIALGIFGNTLKADLVIPNKIYHYASLQKAIVTKDSPAIREIFKDNTDILLCDIDPQAIAQKILLLKNDANLRKFIAQNCYEKISKSYNHKEIARQLIHIATELLEKERSS